MGSSAFKIYIGIYGDETWKCKLWGTTNSCMYSYCSNCCEQNKGEK